MKKPQSSPVFDDSDFPISIVRKSIFQCTGVVLTEAGKRPVIAIASYDKISLGMIMAAA